MTEVPDLAYTIALLVLAAIAVATTTWISFVALKYDRRLSEEITILLSITITVLCVMMVLIVVQALF